MVQHNLAELSDDDTLIAGAKVVYFFYNDINPASIETLLRPLTPLPLMVQRKRTSSTNLFSKKPGGL